MKRCRSMVLLAASLVLTACEKPRTPGVYDVSVSEAYRRLSTDALADLVYSKQCGILIHVTPEGTPDREVTWRVRSGDREVVTFTAVLTPVAEKQTRVEIKMPSDPSGGEVYDGTKTYRRPAFNQPLKPAVAEQVAAILEGRKYDVSRVGPGTDTICNVQRGGLESGVEFHVDDPPN